MRSVVLPMYERTQALEAELLALELEEGDYNVCVSNFKKLQRVLMPVLIGRSNALKLVGPNRFCMCSLQCMSEETGYHFVDNSRIKLSGCSHYSYHVQCVLTALLEGNWCCTLCPIADEPQCRRQEDALGNQGQHHFWN